jgi:hypothetical protein
MKKFLLAMVLSSCATTQKPGFYVQESQKLGKVTVDECNVIAFRDIDNDKVTKRSVCRKIELTGKSKADWERVRPKDGETTILHTKKIQKEDDNESATVE